MGIELVAAVGAVAVALVTGVFTLLTSRSRKENESAHSQNYSVLKSIDKRTVAIDRKLDETSERLAAHEGWHRGRGDPI